MKTVNDDNEFEKNKGDIYPKYLELKKENEGHLQASYLDTEVKITNNQFSIKLYDKRDDFNFKIVRLPFLSNNMPSRIFFSSYSSELLRIARCTTEKDDFLASCTSLIERMWDQGARSQLQRVRSSMHKVFCKHKSVFLSFFQTPKSMIDCILAGRY